MFSAFHRHQLQAANLPPPSEDAFRHWCVGSSDAVGTRAAVPCPSAHRGPAAGRKERLSRRTSVTKSNASRQRGRCEGELPFQAPSGGGGRLVTGAAGSRTRCGVNHGRGGEGIRGLLGFAVAFLLQNWEGSGVLVSKWASRKLQCVSKCLARGPHPSAVLQYVPSGRAGDSTTKGAATAPVRQTARRLSARAWEP